MDRSRIPQGYTPLLNIYETQKAIGLSTACLRTASAAPSASTGSPPLCS